MSVYKKLQDARVELQKTPLQKSGKNTYSGYSYFELSDFMPTVQEIFQRQGLCGVLSFGKEMAALVIHDIDSKDAITFTSPMSSASLKGCHEVQNLGAVESYIRRYLWTTALEIVENDVLDATTGKEPPEKKAGTTLVTNQASPAVWSQPVAQPAPIPVATQPAAIVPIATATVPSVPPGTDVPAKVAGKKAEWQVTVEVDPKADKAAWIDAVNNGVLSALAFVESEADVLTIFRTNKVIFDIYKDLDEPAFKELMAEFTRVKEKYTKKVEE